jgi:hypothetical protein
MRLLLLSVLGLASLANTKPLVPGKAFDRIITIWLENQVSSRCQISKKDAENIH